MDLFLNTFRETAIVWLSCRAAGIARSTVYEWLREDRDGFTERYRDAELDASDRIEAEIHRRGILGIEKPITVAGEREVIREYSDRMLELMAKARMPAKYRDNWEGTAPPPAWAQVQATASATVFVINGEQKPAEAMSEEELAAAEQALLAERATLEAGGEGSEVPNG